MQHITGRISVVEAMRTIQKSEGSFSATVIVLKKKMRKKFRNIAFNCYGRVADEAVKFMQNDKVSIEFLIDSKHYSHAKGSGWNTNLQATEIERFVPKPKFDVAQELNLD